MDEVRSANEILVNKPQGKRYLGDFRRRQDNNNTKMGLTETGCAGMKEIEDDQ